MRPAIQKSALSVAALARRYHLSETTVRKWRNRPLGEVADYPSIRKTNLSSLSEADEQVVGYLRCQLELTMDEILLVARRGWKRSLRRASLYRCLRRGIKTTAGSSGEFWRRRVFFSINRRAVL